MRRGILAVLILVASLGCRAAVPVCGGHSEVEIAPPSGSIWDAAVFERCYDGDTCTITLRGLPAVFGDKIGLRIWGVDTPEKRGRCEKEKELAEEARMLTLAAVRGARRIEFSEVGRGKYFRVVARLKIDGRYLDEMLIEKGLGVPYFGGAKTKDWCAP